jgi:hypothetical protein
MDHSYHDSLGLEVHNDLSGARSMRVIKQERHIPIDRDEKPRKQRKRALVAVSELDVQFKLPVSDFTQCNRCRKRKIKCNGDLNTGLACTSCRTVGATECQYSRVSSPCPHPRIALTQSQVNSLSPEEAARCFVAKSHGRSTLLSMGSPQLRAPYQREEYDMDQSQPSFSRHTVSMDSINYDDQSSTYPQPSNYLLSTNPADYPWANRWDPALRPATSEFFEERMPQAYNFVLPQAQLPTQVPTTTHPEPSTYPEIDRTLSTPTTRLPISTLPENLTGLTQPADPKAFWSRYPERMPYQPQTQRIKPDDADLVFSYIPMVTADEAVPIPSPSSTQYQVLDPEIDCVDRRYRDAGQRLLALSSDCTPDVYGHSSGRKNERASTLMNGLPYTRVRHPDSYNFLPDSLSEYGRVEGLHRPPTLPLGHQGAY